MRFDRQSTGLIAGLVAPVIGFFLYGLIHTGLIRPHLHLHDYIFDLFLGTREYQPKILSLSLIANVPLFFWFDRMGWHRAMRGVIASMFIYGIVIVVLW